MRRWASVGAATLPWLAPLLLGASCRGAGREALVVYSPHGRELLQMVERSFELAHPGVDVRWLDMGSQEVLDRVRSEKANPQADVWFGGPASLFARAARESLLAAYRPTWARSLRPGVLEPGTGDFYFPAYRTPAVITFNSTAVPESLAPADWDEVLEPRWRGKVLIRDPMASGTMRAIFGMIVERSIAATGDTARGFEWLRRLDAQTKEYVMNPALLNVKLERGEGLITLWDLPDVLLVQREGRPLGYVFPRSGTPVIADAIAVLRGARRPALAREFVEWVGSVAMQLRAAREAYRLPARADLPADSLPEWVRGVESRMKPAELDWGLIEAHGAEWMRYWDREVRGSGRRREGSGRGP